MQIQKKLMKLNTKLGKDTSNTPLKIDSKLIYTRNEVFLLGVTIDTSYLLKLILETYAEMEISKM